MTSYHFMYVMTPTMFMTSYPLYMMSHTLCVWHYTIYIWLETHSICHHFHCICHHTHSVEDITPTTLDITGGMCLPSCALSMIPYPPFKTRALSIYDITCPLLMTSYALYMTCHLLCMISRSLYVWHHTMPVSLTSHTLCVWHIHFTCHHRQCYDNTTIV